MSAFIFIFVLISSGSWAARCHLDFAPVCDNSNVTFANQCNACEAYKQNKSLRIAFFADCGDPPNGDDCPGSPEPVCGSNNVTYDSDCARKIAAMDCPCILSGPLGRCNATTSVTSSCTIDWTPRGVEPYINFEAINKLKQLPSAIPSF